MSDVERLEAEIARTRMRLSRSLTAVEAETRMLLDPTTPAEPAASFSDPTGVALYTLGLVKQARRVARSSPAIRLMGIVAASGAAALLVRGWRRGRRVTRRALAS